MRVRSIVIDHLDRLRASKHQRPTLEVCDDERRSTRGGRLECVEGGCVAVPPGNRPPGHVIAGIRPGTTPATKPDRRATPDALDRHIA